ncbi:2Fe-2S iron-sulfur cluster binding domain-containing protein [Pectobacterium versatile]|uniref:pesticin C-terminus-like muramidase n=1 Tax=Pectobacterium versatile TaxID=2488639 RepID=UPI001B3A36DF|nr:pesticin C-terminus-like muramidase [Pectobacterium versatile]MBQ4770736.1 2Fe-2S iron-sulfur cluster binding domain-containing protein [Pectobacterium versatile]
MAKYIVRDLGTNREIECPDDVYILDAFEEAGEDLPYSCRAGSCSTCVALLIHGDVDQSDGSFLEAEDKGLFLLTCSAYPISNCVIRTGAEELLYERVKLRRQMLSDKLRININFLLESEGFKKKGYVPKNKEGKSDENSGVTIGGGVDLGQRDKNELLRDGVPQDLVDILSPYTRIKGNVAAEKLRKSPLSLSDNDADFLTSIYTQKAIRDVGKRFDAESVGLKFNELPTNTRTAIVDLEFQYGNLKVKTPKSWGYITRNEWDLFLKELNDFGDDYKTRRQREAALVQHDLAMQAYLYEEHMREVMSFFDNDFWLWR